MRKIFFLFRYSKFFRTVDRTQWLICLQYNKIINIWLILGFVIIFCGMNALILKELFLKCMIVWKNLMWKVRFKNQACSFSVWHAGIQRSMPSVQAQQNYWIEAWLYRLVTDGYDCCPRPAMRLYACGPQVSMINPISSSNHEY